MSLQPRIINILIVVLSTIVLQSSLAQEDNEASENNNQEPKKAEVKTAKRFAPEIEWYEPEIEPTKRKKVQKVTLYGNLEKGVKILLGKKILWVRTLKSGKKKVKKIPLRKLRVKGEKLIVLEKSGNFKISFRLPEGEVQIPVRLKKNKQRASYQIAMFVKAKKIEIKNAKPFKTDCRYCFWIGAGANYLSYQQDPPQDIKDVSYGAFGAPALSFRTNLQIVKNWRIRFDYHLLSGPE